MKLDCKDKLRIFMSVTIDMDIFARYTIYKLAITNCCLRYSNRLTVLGGVETAGFSILLEGHISANRAVGIIVSACGIALRLKEKK